MPENKKHVITLDGPAGAGKSSIAKYLAKNLENFAYLDTGSIYRAIAVAVDHGIPQDDGSYKSPVSDEKILDSGLEAMFYRNKNGGYTQCMMVGGRIIPDKDLRTPEASERSSVLSTDPKIRDCVNIISREAARDYDLIAEGRDTGTVLFPDADLKFYLWAPVNDRADRRRMQTHDRRDLDEIAAEIKIRDKRDSTREHSPLRVPDDAIWIDTGMLLEDTMKRLLYDIIAARLVPGYAKAI